MCWTCGHWSCALQYHLIYAINVHLIHAQQGRTERCLGEGASARTKGHTWSHNVVNTTMNACMCIQRVLPLYSSIYATNMNYLCTYELTVSVALVVAASFLVAYAAATTSHSWGHGVVNVVSMSVCINCHLCISLYLDHNDTQVHVQCTWGCLAQVTYHYGHIRSTPLKVILCTTFQECSTQEKFTHVCLI